MGTQVQVSGATAPPSAVVSVGVTAPESMVPTALASTVTPESLVLPPSPGELLEQPQKVIAPSADKSSETTDDATLRAYLAARWRTLATMSSATKTTVKKTAAPKKATSKTPTKKAPEKSAFPAIGTTGSSGPSAGTKAPAISAVDEAGKPFRLSALAGKKVVLYFYPKAMTSGCTRESEAFRDQQAAFTRAGAVIVGASPDASAAQLKFKEKYTLPFTLIADTDRAVATAYGVWKEKSLYGRKFMGIERTTFLIDAKGVVQRVWNKVKVDGHVDQVLAAVKAP